MKILAIVGSLRNQSFNRQLAMYVKDYYKDNVEFEILEYADVPMMNQDTEFPAPEAIARVREKVLAADGIWFFTPEYNHAVPGVLKNLVDWLSRPVGNGVPPVIAGKPAAISGTSPGMSGTLIAQDALLVLLSFVGMLPMANPRVAIPNVNSQAEDGVLKLSQSKKYIERQADSFLEYISKNS